MSESSTSSSLSSESTSLSTDSETSSSTAPTTSTASKPVSVAATPSPQPIVPAPQRPKVTGKKKDPSPLSSNIHSKKHHDSDDDSSVSSSSSSSSSSLKTSSGKGSSYSSSSSSNNASSSLESTSKSEEDDEDNNNNKKKDKKDEKEKRNSSIQPTHQRQISNFVSVGANNDTTKKKGKGKAKSKGKDAQDTSSSSSTSSISSSSSSSSSEFACSITSPRPLVASSRTVSTRQISPCSPKFATKNFSPCSPRFNGSSTTPRQIRILADSSSSSSESSSGKHKKDSASDSGGDDDGDDDFNLDKDDDDDDDDDEEDSDSKSEGHPNKEKEKEKEKGSYSESDSDSDSESDKKPLRNRKSAKVGIELSIKKDGEFKDDTSDDEDDGKPQQRPHKHSSSHKMTVVMDNENVEDIEGDDDKEEDKDKDKDKKKEKTDKTDKTDKESKKKNKSWWAKRKRRKHKKKGKKHKKKKKTLSGKISSALHDFWKYAKSSIKFTTITFFIIAYVVILVTFSGLNTVLYGTFRDKDFDTCDNVIDQVANSVLHDAAKMSDALLLYSLWNETAEAITAHINGDPQPLRDWHQGYFYWNGEWLTTLNYNLLAVYDTNHTFILGDYHPSSGFQQITTQEEAIPEYFKQAASLEFTAVAASRGNVDKGRQCLPVMPPGTTRPMIVCHHPVYLETLAETAPAGYIVMAIDLRPKAAAYATETCVCISVWEDIDTEVPDAHEAIANVRGGSIGANGKWDGSTYHKYYKTADLARQTNETGTFRTCPRLLKFQPTEHSVASFLLFEDRIPGHKAGPLFRVDHAAAMEHYGSKPVRDIYIIITIVFLAVTVAILVYLDIVVLRRITSLSNFLDTLSKDASKERQEVLDARKPANGGGPGGDDDDDLGRGSSKASRRDAPGTVVGSSKHSQRIMQRRDSRSHSVLEETDSDEDSTSTSTTASTSTSTTASTSTSTTTASTTTSTTTASTTSTTASTTSSKAVSVASSESTVTGTTTGTSGTSGTTTSSDSGDSTGSSSGNKHDEVWRVQKAMKNNVDVLKDDITAANISIRKERHWRRRCNHALRLMNLWCGRRDVFPGLRGKDKAVSSASTPSLAEPGADQEGGGGALTTSGNSSSIVPKDDTTGRGYEDMSVDDVLARPIAMEFLKVHCRFEESQENIFFLLDVTWLQELERLEEVESDPVKKAQMHDTIVSVADHIVRRYIAQGAPQEINISSESMSIVRQLSGSYSKGMFAKAIYDVKMMTSMDVLARFKHTPAFLAMSEALDVETYDMMSAAAAKKAKSGNHQRKGSSSVITNPGGGGISTGEIQVSAPDLRSDALGGSDDEDDEDEDNLNEFEDDDEGNDDNSITNIDKPFRSTFRLMSAIADGAYKPSVAITPMTGSFFSAADIEGGDMSDSGSILSGTTTPRKGSRATGMGFGDAREKSPVNSPHMGPSMHYRTNSSSGAIGRGTSPKFGQSKHQKTYSVTNALVRKKGK